MKLIIQKDYKTVHRLITNYYDDYNTINNSQVDEDTYFLVCEKYFFRNGSRASLSIVISQIDTYSCKLEAVGSGGGQGMFFKFDWGAKGSFERDITMLLEQKDIKFKEVY
jgi:hypothetical protein